jgi:hypothetical protein
MFSLLLAVVAIILVAAVAYATFFYGGTIGATGQASAEASALLSQSAQIVSASAAFANEHYGAKPATLEALVSAGYLSSIPSGWQEPQGAASPLTSKEITSAHACELLNARQSIVGIPRCSDVGEVNKPICCQ